MKQPDKNKSGKKGFISVYNHITVYHSPGSTVAGAHMTLTVKSKEKRMLAYLYSAQFSHSYIVEGMMLPTVG